MGGDRTGIVAISFGLMVLASCGAGVESGAGTAWALLGKGPAVLAETDSDDAADQQASPVPTEIPPPLKPVPEDTLYAPQVVAQQKDFRRAAHGDQAALQRLPFWDRAMVKGTVRREPDAETAEAKLMVTFHLKQANQPIMGQGTVTQVGPGFNQGSALLWLDADGDEEADLLLIFTNSGQRSLTKAEPGMRVWFTGIYSLLQGKDGLFSLPLEEDAILINALTLEFL